MARRRYNVQSSSTSLPPLWLVVLGGGLILGVLLGSQVLRPGVDDRDDAFLVMAATLFSQGESVPVLNERLIAVGFPQPMVSVSQAGEAFSNSSIRWKQRQADTLTKLGKSLGESSPAPVTLIGPVANTSAPGATPGATSTTPDADSTPAALGQTVVGPSITGAVPSALAPTKGRVSPSGGGSARLREKPNVASKDLQIVPFGAPVEIIDTVQGQAVEPNESRWYQVKYGSLTGYIYFKLVAIGD
ncbi:MAG TPA: SH3 domain-containing protein [Chloroflexota bacterium]|nr:SH3 domain-containing protein [Chloroflexota bacterium]